MSDYTVRLCPKEPKGEAIKKTSSSEPSAQRGSQDSISDLCAYIQELIDIAEFTDDEDRLEFLNRRLELCQQFSEAEEQAETNQNEILSVPVYTIPLQSCVCEPRSDGIWEVPLTRGDCDSFKQADLETIRWEQEVTLITTPFGPVTHTTDYWIFTCRIPDGIVPSTLCTQCFPVGGAGLKNAYLSGSLGFDADTGKEVWEEAEDGTKRRTGELQWRVHRNDLPLPGEALFVEVPVGSGGGEMSAVDPVCPAAQCDTPGTDCYFYREYSRHITGMFWLVGTTFFATPTWTGGLLLDYYTDSLGWVGFDGTQKTYPECFAYGDISLKYKVRVEGKTLEVTSVGFAGYALGMHVLLRKLGKTYGEPFSDSCLGVGEDTPAEDIELEKIGESDGTAFPSLSTLSNTPIDRDREVTIITSYDYFVSDGWHTVEMVVVMDANGYCFGDCVDGQLNMDTGEWIRDIEWIRAPNRDSTKDPDDKVDIVCTYTKKAQPWGGVVMLPWHVMGMGG